MKIKLTDKLKILYEKLKKVKHIHIYIAVGLALIVMGIYFLSLPSNKTNNEQTNIDIIDTNFDNSGEYIDYLENKLESVITRVKGIESVDVVITLEKGFEYVYATEEETKTTSNGTTISSSSVVMVDGQPVIKEEIYPIVKGVVIIAKGVENLSVKMNVLSVIQTVIDVDNSKINIIAGQ